MGHMARHSWCSLSSLSSLSAMPAALLVAIVSLSAAPQQQPPLRDSRRFRTGVVVIAVTATVTDRDGHLVTGLPRETFEMYEDGIRQTITQFTNERVPVGVGVLLDIS